MREPHAFRQNKNFRSTELGRLYFVSINNKEVLKLLWAGSPPPPPTGFCHIKIKASLIFISFQVNSLLKSCETATLWVIRVIVIRGRMEGIKNVKIVCMTRVPNVAWGLNSLGKRKRKRDKRQMSTAQYPMTKLSTYDTCAWQLLWTSGYISFFK